MRTAARGPAAAAGTNALAAGSTNKITVVSIFHNNDGKLSEHEPVCAAQLGVHSRKKQRLVVRGLAGILGKRSVYS